MPLIASSRMSKPGDRGLAPEGFFRVRGAVEGGGAARRVGEPTALNAAPEPGSLVRTAAGLAILVGLGWWHRRRFGALLEDSIAIED